MTRIAFTADLHADDRGKAVDPETGLNRGFLDGLDMIRWVGEHSRELEAEALVVAGDYTEHKTPAPWRVARIVEALRTGPDRQVHVRGNHDSLRAGTGIVSILGGMPGWTDHGAHPGIDLVDDVAICSIPFTDRSWFRAQAGNETLSQAELYRQLGEQYVTVARALFVQAEQAGAKSSVLVGHQQLSGGQMTDAQAAFLGDLDLVVDARALSAIGFSAVIFGHVHRGQTVIDDPACPVVFTGSTHRVDFAEELEEKTWLIVDFEDGLAAIERISLPARRYVTLTGDGAFSEFGVEDTVVRGRDLDPDVDVVELRRALEAAGALEVMELRKRPAEATVATAAMSEELTPQQALSEYFDGDPDREPLVERGRELLAEVA